MRSLAVVVFIALVAGAGLYLYQRPTVARGSVVAADLLASNPAVLKQLDCDDEIPIGINGATFSCVAQFKLGAVRHLTFELTRAGNIKQVGNEAMPTEDTPIIHKDDPWQ